MTPGNKRTKFIFVTGGVTSSLGKGLCAAAMGALLETRGLNIGVGLPTDPKTSVGVGGANNRVYIEKSGGDLASFETVDIPAGGRLLYWREVP